MAPGKHRSSEPFAESDVLASGQVIVPFEMRSMKKGIGLEFTTGEPQIKTLLRPWYARHSLVEWLAGAVVLGCGVFILLVAYILPWLGW